MMKQVDQAKFISYINSNTQGGGLYTDIIDSVKVYVRDKVVIAKTYDKQYFILEETECEKES